MASKIKNGLFRIQCYLTEEAFEIFNRERESHNQKREAIKLSESGFCQLKITGTLPLQRGAPKGNKNAVGRRKDRGSKAENTSSALVERDQPTVPSSAFGADQLSTNAANNEAKLLDGKGDVADSATTSQKASSLSAARSDKRDDFLTDRQTILTSYDCSDGEYKIAGGNEQTLSEKSVSDSDKTTWTADDFEHLFENIDRLGDPAEGIDDEKDQKSALPLQKDPAAIESNDFQSPFSAGSGEQPSLF